MRMRGKRTGASILVPKATRLSFFLKDFFRITSKILKFGTCHFTIIERNIKAILTEHFSSLRFDSGKTFEIINNYWTRLSKYRDSSVASRSIIRLRQIIDLRDTDKSRYFARTEFNNCFIIRSPSLFVCFFFFNEYPREAKRSAIFTQRRSQEGEKHGFL